jgi:hypothetical protein
LQVRGNHHRARAVISRVVQPIRHSHRVASLGVDDNKRRLIAALPAARLATRSCLWKKTDD